MESIISLPATSFPKKTQLSETFITVEDEDFYNDKKPANTNSQNHFTRSVYNMSFRGPVLPKEPSTRGSVRRSVKNFELRLNGVKRKAPLPRSGQESPENIVVKQDIILGLKQNDNHTSKKLMKKEPYENVSTVSNKSEIEVSTKNECNTANNKVKDVKPSLYENTQIKSSEAMSREAESQISICTQTQADNYETLKHRMKLIPIANLNQGESGNGIIGTNGGDDSDVNPMHVVSLNPKAKKGKNGPTPPRVLKRRMSISGDEQTEKFSRLTRFGSGLRKKLSESTRDIFGSTSAAPPIPPKEDNASLAGSKQGFKRHLSSSMRDLFGGSFSLKGEKDIRDRFGKFEERKKEKNFRQSAFLIGGGITIGRSAGRNRGMLRDSFRDILPKLRMTRVFEVNVVLPDGTETSVSNYFIYHLQVNNNA